MAAAHTIGAEITAGAQDGDLSRDEEGNVIWTSIGKRTLRNITLGSSPDSRPCLCGMEQVVIDRILLKRFFSALAGSSVTIVTGLATLGIARSGDNSPEGGEAAPNCSSCPACP